MKSKNWSQYIIAITVIIKVVFWPMTAASTRSQKRQQAIGKQEAGEIIDRGCDHRCQGIANDNYTQSIT